jgi:hypothetical protein
MKNRVLQPNYLLSCAIRDKTEVQPIIMPQRLTTFRHSKYHAYPQYNHSLSSQQTKSKNLHTASNQAGISQAIALPHWIKRFSPPPSPTTQKLWNTLGNLGITSLQKQNDRSESPSDRPSSPHPLNQSATHQTKP